MSNSEQTILINCLKDHGWLVENVIEGFNPKFIIRRRGADKKNTKKLAANRDSVLTFLGYNRHEAHLAPF